MSGVIFRLMRKGFLIFVSVLIMSLLIAVRKESNISRLITNRRPRHHHYKVIDMGTFGGSISAIDMATDIDDNAISKRGSLVGYSATSTPKLRTSQELICGGDDGFGTHVTHAFEWGSEGAMDLGALEPSATDCSNAYQVNARGEVAGVSENGEFDPQIGQNQSRAGVGGSRLHAYLWKEGNAIDLGALDGDCSSRALAMAFRRPLAGAIPSGEGYVCFPAGYPQPTGAS